MSIKEKENLKFYEAKIITKQYNEMNLYTTIKNSKLFISCSYKKNYIEKIFSNSFSLDDLKKDSRFYSLFDDETQILNEIIHNQSKGKEYIEENENINDKIKLIIPIALYNYPNISFELMEIKKTIEEKLKELEMAINYYKNEFDIEKFDSKILIGKDREKRIIKSWIAPNKKLKAKLLYSFHDLTCTNNKSDMVGNFHEACDNKNKILIIGKSKNEIFGGYTPLFFHSLNKYARDDKSFLFSLNKFEKYPKNSNSNTESIWCLKDYGPCFHYDLNFKKKKMNVIQFKRSKYLTPDNWVNIKNCNYNSEGILLESLEIFQIKEEEYKTDGEDKDNDKDIYKDKNADKINNNNDNSFSILNFDNTNKNNIINITNEEISSNSNEINQSNLDESKTEEDKKLIKMPDGDDKKKQKNKNKESEDEYEENNDYTNENVSKVSRSNDNQNDLFFGEEKNRDDSLENKSYLNVSRNEYNPQKKESDSDENSKEKYSNEVEEEKEDKEDY